MPLLSMTTAIPTIVAMPIDEGTALLTVLRTIRRAIPAV